MTDKTLMAIYARLRGHELAHLAYQAVAMNDLREADRVLAMVPEAERRAYERRLVSLDRLATRFGLEHWQLRARLYASIGVRLYYRDDPEKGHVGQESRVLWSRYLVALDEALTIVCEENGINQTAIRALADAVPVDQTYGTDLAMRDEFLRLMRAVL